MPKFKSGDKGTYHGKSVTIIRYHEDHPSRVLMQFDDRNPNLGWKADKRDSERLGIPVDTGYWYAQESDIDIIETSLDKFLAYVQDKLTYLMSNKERTPFQNGELYTLTISLHHLGYVVEEIPQPPIIKINKKEN
jgi:hypothetical protein